MTGNSTKTIHSGYVPNDLDGAIIPPLHLSTTFKFGNKGGNFEANLSEESRREKNKFRFGGSDGYDYSRTINPTRYVLEEVIAALDGNDYGLAYSSGSAALAAVVHLLTKGEEILFSTDVYGGTYRYIVNLEGVRGTEYRIADLTDLKSVKDSFKKGNIKIVWVETPTNPLLKVVDIEALAKIVHENGAILVVDNTFASPIVQSPKDLGADIVVYSTTKYINGHSDSIGGAISTSNKDTFSRLKFIQNSIGAMLSPFDSWLTLRGIKTLELRMERHLSNAESVADFLQKHEKVAHVYYPKFFKGEQKEIVDKQMRGFGGMISIELKDKYDEAKFVDNLKLFPLAESLGGVESLLDHPATMTHGSIPKEEREKIGLSDSLFRLSIGVENVDDLLGDLEHALSIA